MTLVMAGMVWFPASFEGGPVHAVGGQEKVGVSTSSRQSMQSCMKWMQLIVHPKLCLLEVVLCTQDEGCIFK